MCGCNKTPKKRKGKVKRVIRKIWKESQNPKQKIKKLQT